VCLLNFLGRLLRVSLIKWVSNVHLSTKIFFDFIEIWCVGRGRRVINDSMQYDPIQGQGHEPLKVWNSAIFNSYFLPHLQWGLANDQRFLNQGAIHKAHRGWILDFCPSFCHLTLKLAVSMSRPPVPFGANFISSLSSFRTFFFPYAFSLTYLLPYSFTTWLVCLLELFHFHRRWPNLGFSFFVLILCCCIFCYGCMFAFVVFVFVFQY